MMGLTLKIRVNGKQTTVVNRRRKSNLEKHANRGAHTEFNFQQQILRIFYTVSTKEKAQLNIQCDGTVELLIY